MTGHQAGRLRATPSHYFACWDGIMKRVLVAASLFTLLGGGALTWYLWPRRHAIYTDGQRIHQPAGTAVLREILWQPPLPVPGPINSPSDDYEPRLTADGLTLFFVRGKAGHNADLYYSRRGPDGWSAPAPVPGVTSQYDELGGQPSPDGRSLYFYSDRPGGAGGYDLWVAHRRPGEELAFAEPLNLGPLVNSPLNEYGPALTPDGEMLYFASNRPRPEDARLPDEQAWPATVREDLYRHDYDLYRASVTGRGVGRAQPLASVNTAHNEGSPAFSPVGDFLYFSSDRPGGRGGFDLYRSRLLRGRQEAPTNLGPAVNTTADELDPGPTMGGYALYFSSNRPLDSIRSGPSDDYDVYRTASREVFTEV